MEQFQLDNAIFGDIAEIEKTLSEDVTGDRARAMIDYFDVVLKTAEGDLQRAVIDAERQLVSKLIEGFRASQRIIRHVWETLHSTTLPG